MTRRLNCWALAVALLVAGPALVMTEVAVAAPQGCACAYGADGSCVQCPQCAGSFCPPAEEYCELEVSQGKVERECFEVDFKTICIPRVVPPWRKDCCEPVCAEARSVKILTTKKYECPVCEYKWHVRKPALPQIPGAVPADGQGYQPVPLSNTAPGAQGWYQQSQIQPGHVQPGQIQPGYAPAGNPWINAGIFRNPGQIAAPATSAPSTGAGGQIQTLGDSTPAAPTSPPATEGGTIGDYFGR